MEAKQWLSNPSLFRAESTNNVLCSNGQLTITNLPPSSVPSELIVSEVSAIYEEGEKNKKMSYQSC